MPSFLIILSIALFFRQYQHLEVVERIFKGIRPAVVALIASPCFKMARTARINLYNCWIPVAAALLIWLFGFSPIYVIVITGIGGYCYGRYENFGRSKVKIAEDTEMKEVEERKHINKKGQKGGKEQ